MAEFCTLNWEEGPCALVYFSKRKSIKAFIDGNLQLVVQAPRSLSEIRIKEFLNSRKARIHELLQRAREKAEARSKRQRYFYLFSKPYEIEIFELYGSCYFADGKLFAPSIASLEAFRKELAKTLLKRLLDRHARRMGLSYKRVSCKKMTKRLGSCNKTLGSINLNEALLHMPLRLASYVCIHELSHLVHANHQKGFYALLESFCPNYKELERELKKTIF